MLINYNYSNIQKNTYKSYGHFRTEKQFHRDKTQYHNKIDVQLYKRLFHKISTT